MIGINFISRLFKDIGQFVYNIYDGTTSFLGKMFASLYLILTKAFSIVEGLKIATFFLNIVLWSVVFKYFLGELITFEYIYISVCVLVFANFFIMRR